MKIDNKTFEKLFQVIGLTYLPLGVAILLSQYTDFYLRIAAHWFLIVGIMSLFAYFDLILFRPKIKISYLKLFYIFQAYLFILVLPPLAILTGALARITGLSPVEDYHLYIFLPNLIILALVFIFREEIAKRLKPDKFFENLTTRKIKLFIGILMIFTFLHLYWALGNIYNNFLVTEIHAIFMTIFSYLFKTNYSRYKKFRIGKYTNEEMKNFLISDGTFLGISFVVLDPLLLMAYPIGK